MGTAAKAGEASRNGSTDGGTARCWVGRGRGSALHGCAHAAHLCAPRASTERAQARRRLAADAGRRWRRLPVACSHPGSGTRAALPGSRPQWAPWVPGPRLLLRPCRPAKTLHRGGSVRARQTLPRTGEEATSWWPGPEGRERGRPIARAICHDGGRAAAAASVCPSSAKSCPVLPLRGWRGFLSRGRETQRPPSLSSPCLKRPALWRARPPRSEGQGYQQLLARYSVGDGRALQSGCVNTCPFTPREGRGEGVGKEEAVCPPGIERSLP